MVRVASGVVFTSRGNDVMHVVICALNVFDCMLRPQCVSFLCPRSSALRSVWFLSLLKDQFAGRRSWIFHVPFAPSVVNGFMSLWQDSRCIVELNRFRLVPFVVS
ncbi:hypothetical protein VTN49DRAFT_1850 [Thermomyces lanuginosus]|uniref:uncharacterized protein n=1 Tax=Thermomyces lanuginosus TaxID=5541 RepID=UPI003742DE14